MGSKLDRTLTIKDGIPLAFGSIMGSGILFLPALTFSIAHENVLLAWVLATLLCFPLLGIFKDMFARVDSEAGVSGYVKLAFGETIGSTVPILFLATVALGMPSAALIAGSYLSTALSLPASGATIFALAIPWLSYFFNSFGIKFGAKSQMLITVTLVGIAIAVFALTLTPALESNTQWISSVKLSPLFLAVAVAFWAFAGFENISFMAGEFKNPERDLFWSSVIALTVCGILYLSLAFSYAALVPASQVNVRSGLLQLAEHSPWPSIVSKCVGLFAFVAVLLNFNSWMWGISRMIYSEAEQGRLPRVLAVVNEHKVPQLSLLFLASLFSVVIGLSTVFPRLLEPILVVVSADFVLIYIMCSGSYFVLNRGWKRRLGVVFVGTMLGAAALQSGLMLLYPIAVLLLASLKARLDQRCKRDRKMT